MELGKPTPVRLTTSTERDLKRLAKQTNVSVSALIRLAVSAGAPLLVEQFAAPAQRKITASKEAAHA